MINKTTENTKLKEVFDRLEKSENVLGVILYGSLANNLTTIASDYDILVIFSDLNNEANSSFTYIDDTPTDIFYSTFKEIKSIKNKVDANTREDWLVNWIQNGRIIFDKTDILKNIKSQKIEIVFPPINLNNCLYIINHNFVQDSRYFKLKSKQYHDIYRIKLAYSMNNILYSFFCINEIPWRGEKWAVLLLQKEYKKFYKQYTDCLYEQDPEIQFNKYKTILDTILAPHGGLWSKEVFADYLNKNQKHSKNRDLFKTFK